MEQFSHIKTHKIMSMETEKKERIINAALIEFCKGYKQASTDVIVKKAGISKGLLFHYFATKKELLTFLYAYAMEKLMAEYIGKINLKEPDLLKRLQKMCIIKMEMLYKNPAIFDFIIAIFLNKEEEFSDLQEQSITTYQLTWHTESQLFANIDYNLFKEDIDAKTAIEIIRHTFTGYSETVIQQYKTQVETIQVKENKEQIDKVLEQTKKYMDFFEKIFYK